MSSQDTTQPATTQAQPATNPPYQPGDRIADRVSVNQATYEVRSCLSLPDGVNTATGARWQVTYAMPGEHLGYVWVDDDGYQPAGTFGPPVDPEAAFADSDRRVLADLLAPYSVRLPLTEPIPDYVADRVLEAFAEASQESEHQYLRLLDDLRYAVLNRAVTVNMADGEAIAATDNTYEQWDARVWDATKAIRELIRERTVWPVMQHHARRQPQIASGRVPAGGAS